jgi:hypothetical protein
MKDLLIKEKLIDPIRKDYEYLTISDESSTSDQQSTIDAELNETTLSTIRLKCSDGPLFYIRDETSAYKAWKKLEDIYHPKGFTTEYLTLRQLFQTSQSDFSSMKDYLNKVKTLISDLAGKNINLPDQVVIAWVLNNRGEPYAPLTQNIIQSLRKDPAAYTIDSLFACLIDEARGHHLDHSGQYDHIYTTHAAASSSYHMPNNHGQKAKNAHKRLPYQGKYCFNCKRKNHNVYSLLGLGMFDPA